MHWCLITSEKTTPWITWELNCSSLNLIFLILLFYFFPKCPALPLLECVNLTRLLSKLADSGGYFRPINSALLMPCLACFLSFYNPIKELANIHKWSTVFAKKTCFRPRRGKERKEASRDILGSSLIANGLLDLRGRLQISEPSEEWCTQTAALDFSCLLYERWTVWNLSLYQKQKIFFSDR